MNPKGVVCMFSDENGNVITSSNDFDRSGYGGFKLHEAQEIRAKERLYYKVANAYCSPQFVKGIERHQCKRIVENLVREYGCKITTEYIGWNLEEE